MPELPDVEAFRRYFESTALYQRITDVEIRSQQILETKPERLRQGLVGRQFEGTWRHGKHLFAALDNGCWLELHFGMSGNLTYFKKMDQDPEYDRFLIAFDNGYHLAYTAPRKLGEVDLIEDVDAYVEGNGLGPDVYSDEFDLAQFRSLLSDRRGMIKSALMDQSLMAGIGNVYSDEILFQVGIHPRTKVQDLSDHDLASIFDTMQEVLATAIEHQARPTDYPDTYLTPHRGQEGVCPECGVSLERVKVAGRSAYICPERQRQPKGA